MTPPQSSSIAYLSTYPPRECGIASFTKDLTEAIQKKYNPALKPKVLAIQADITDIFAYDKHVIKHITANNIEDYIALARELNKDPELKLVHIQHEFGIFGGDWGDYLIPFFQTIQKPIIVTLHTVLPKPGNELLRVVRFILQHSKAVIVMNEFSREILQENYGANEKQISVIPHGIPYVASPNGQTEKQRLGLERHFVLSTFGLLNPGKGIEYALHALPSVVKRFPHILYLIIGETHPLVRKVAGETYRNFLQKEVERLHLQRNVRFYNKYLPAEEIIALLRSTDIYLSPTLDRNQSSSGTLSYALGCGTPVICTDSLYAQSIVSADSGILVPPKDSKAIRKALVALCKNPKRLKEMGKTAFAQTRHMTWPNVALAHFKLYQKFVRLTDEQKIPEFTLRHLVKLTDSLGVVQFAKHTEPELRYGYSTDDNARALMVAARALRSTAAGAKFGQAVGGGGRSESGSAAELIKRYLAFLSFVQRPSGIFANLVDSKRRIPRQEISQDTQGRTLWALGYLLAEEQVPTEIRKKAHRLFRKAIPVARKLTSPRAIAFALLGFALYANVKPNIRYKKFIEKLADLQLTHYKETAEKDWLWFEQHLTYSNSKLSESLFAAYGATRKSAYLKVAEKTLEFLLDITFEKGYFSPIGQNGWYVRHGERAYFDQQPEDTSSMVETLIAAFRATGKERYRTLALHTFQWFLGKNHLNQMVYDEGTGGCYDGLGQHTLNLNQGAESTISYLLARLAIEDV